MLVHSVMGDVYCFTYSIIKGSYEGIGNLCWVWTNNKTTLDFLLSNPPPHPHPQVLTIVYDVPVKYYFWRFWCMITRLRYLVQLSIYYTRALVHQYCLAMKYRWICVFLVLGENPTLIEMVMVSIYCLIPKQIGVHNTLSRVCLNRMIVIRQWN